MVRMLKANEEPGPDSVDVTKDVAVALMEMMTREVRPYSEGKKEAGRVDGYKLATIKFLVYDEIGAAMRVIHELQAVLQQEKSVVGLAAATVVYLQLMEGQIAGLGREEISAVREACRSFADAIVEGFGDNNPFAHCGPDPNAR